MRTITVFASKQDIRRNITTAATTYGEIRGEFTDLLTEGMSAKIVVEGSSKGTVDSDDYVLPTGDFTILLVPTKNKSGNGSN
jgi:hypothetical protein